MSIFSWLFGKTNHPKDAQKNLSGEAVRKAAPANDARSLDAQRKAQETFQRAVKNFQDTQARIQSTNQRTFQESHARAQKMHQQAINTANNMTKRSRGW
jgi:hypothetical protein